MRKRQGSTEGTEELNHTETNDIFIKPINLYLHKGVCAIKILCNIIHKGKSISKFKYVTSSGLKTPGF